MREIRVTQIDGPSLHIPVHESEDGSLLAERIAKQVNNAKLSDSDRLIQLGHGKYVLASVVRQVWFVSGNLPPQPATS